MSSCGDPIDGAFVAVDSFVPAPRQQPSERSQCGHFGSLSHGTSLGLPTPSELPLPQKVGDGRALSEKRNLRFRVGADSVSSRPLLHGAVDGIRRSEVV